MQRTYIHDNDVHLASDYPLWSPPSQLVIFFKTASYINVALIHFNLSFSQEDCHQVVKCHAGFSFMYKFSFMLTKRDCEKFFPAKLIFKINTNIKLLENQALLVSWMTNYQVTFVLFSIQSFSWLCAVGFRILIAL